jgi:SAM-dependent methyltransferase
MTGNGYYDTLAAYYDLFFSDFAGNCEREGGRLDALLGPRGVRTVLDACCGTGRQAVPLARLGYAVTAVDPCEAMLAEARRHADRDGLDIRFERAGFLDLPALALGSFDAVLALGNGLCHQDDGTDICGSLSALRETCRSGGVCLVGIKDYDAIRRSRPAFYPRRVREAGETLIMLFERWEYEDPLLLCTCCLARVEGEATVLAETTTHEYMLGAAEFIALAGEAGFETVERVPHPSEDMYLLS